ncbi:FecR family protein [Desertivirga xinjiangensis]|uniref:FecR family protein n=1 Tax=Desertivirga xinjiangensis TaxID=539206 RepID=UPI00210CAF2F|nr:FecR domain-containing protein [Pedobacter xinjiangensis]
MDRKELDQLLKRYSEGKCTAQEKIILEQWFDAQSNAGSWDFEEKEETHTEEIIKKRIDRRLESRKTQWGIIFKAAAVLLLVSSIIFFNRTKIYNAVNPVVYIEKHSSEDQQIKITLSDGSKVWLNENSKLKYPEKFNGEVREVTLEGEAYFDIQHDKEKPFIVKSLHTTTQVLGTAFNIRAYPFLSNVSVAVTRGKVRVSEQSAGGASESTVLLPNDQVSVDRTTGTLRKIRVDSSGVTSWQKGYITFNAERLADISAMLESEYPVKIRFRQEELKDYRLTAGFSSKERIEDILEILARINSLSYQIDGNTVYFTRN